MKYQAFVDVYEELSATPKKLEKTRILAAFLKKLEKEGKYEWIYLLRGKVLADYDTREFGISTQLVLKGIGLAYGILASKVLERFKKVGDLGGVAAFFASARNQKSLFSKTLETSLVFGTLRSLLTFEGKGTVEKKLRLVAELLTFAIEQEAMYIIRTLLNDLRIGVADALLIDALAQAYFPGDEEMRAYLTEKYDLSNDFALLFRAAKEGKESLEAIDLSPGKPLNVMLAVKADTITEAFRICGTPAAIEYKYDGFRVLISKKGKEIFLFTRRLENVTKQFPDVVAAVQKFIHAKDFIADAEIVGYDPETRRYKPFEAVSQRIKRKYDILDMAKKLPVEINVFDLLYCNGKNLMREPFFKRRELLEKIVESKEWVIRPAVQIIAHTEQEALAFYKQALKVGEEGIMIKKLDAPYLQGRKVGYMAKLKPTVHDLDLVIVGAEHGTGKRGGWLTSYIVACKDNGKFLEVGKVSSGLKEKEEEGTTYKEMTRLLKPLIIEEKDDSVVVKPELVVSVTYQNFQQSPGYSSGYALRFPRITQYRPDRKPEDIATLQDIIKEMKKGQR